MESALIDILYSLTFAVNRDPSCTVFYSYAGPLIAFCPITSVATQREMGKTIDHPTRVGKETQVRLRGKPSIWTDRCAREVYARSSFGASKRKKNTTAGRDSPQTRAMDKRRTFSMAMVSWTHGMLRRPETKRCIKPIGGVKVHRETRQYFRSVYELSVTPDRGEANDTAQW